MENGEWAGEKLISSTLNINVCLGVLLFLEKLLRCSDWMTAITCMENPTRHLMDNTWQKNVCVYAQVWVRARFQFLLLSLLLFSPQKPDPLKWRGWTRPSPFSSMAPLRPQVMHVILLRLHRPTGDTTWKHNLTPPLHSFSSIRLDWNFPAHFPGAVKWAVSHVSEPAPIHLL